MRVIKTFFISVLKMLRKIYIATFFFLNQNNFFNNSKLFHIKFNRWKFIKNKIFVLHNILNTPNYTHSSTTFESDTIRSISKNPR